MLNVVLSKPLRKEDIWGRYLLYQLICNSNVKFRVEQDIFPKLGIGRECKMIPFKIEDKFFIIDEWDYCHPTANIKLLSELPLIYQSFPPTILKIQYSLNDLKIYKEIYDKFQIKIFPFTMFPRHDFPLEHFEYKYKEDSSLYFFSGKRWRGRRSWIKKMKSQKFAFVFEVDDGVSKVDRHRHKNNWAEEKEFLSYLKKVKWGVILKGKGVGKNRREVEYSSCGIPLALNYKPIYPFKFEPNIDYVYLEKPEDLEGLKDIDPIPFSRRSKMIYERYFSKEGIYNCFNKAFLKS
jgi:hypothetical protein